MIIPIKDYDRYVLIVKENNQYIDVNFLQGLDISSFNELDIPNRKPNVLLTEIVKRYQYNNRGVEISEINMVNKCIEFYCESFIFDFSDKYLR